MWRARRVISAFTRVFDALCPPYSTLLRHPVSQIRPSNGDHCFVPQGRRAMASVLNAPYTRILQRMSIWSPSDVLDGVEYRLELCQDGDCRRFFRLLPDGAPRSADVESVALTEKVTRRDLLVRRSILRLAEHTRLDSGEPYFVDAHGVWLLRQELEDWREADAGKKSFNDIAWATRMPPRFPPR